MDTSNIDIKTVIDQLSCIAWQKPVRSHGETVYKGGPCPFCHQGTDRFAVFPEGEKPHFYCGINGNGCGAHGDVISFVQQIKGYPSVSQAIQDLQVMGMQIGDTGSSTPFRMRLPKGDSPVQKWQDQGKMIVHIAQRVLWSSVGKEALDYLHSRGLTAETIQRFCLGYWPKWTEHQLCDWGLEGEGIFWIRPSILIPCYEKDVLWGINQRITAYTPKELAQGKQLPRYRQVRGSGNGLFNVDAIQAGEVLFVTEGEIDAMTIVQATGSSAVAMGSTQGAKVSRWVVSLSIASCMLIAFDNDGGKGEKAAEYWTQTIFPQKAFYWRPWAKDVNEMLQSGQDLTFWASVGLAMASHTAHVGSSAEEFIDPLNFCSVCHSEVEMFTPEGIPYCLPCYEKQSAPNDVLVQPVVQEIIELFGAEVRLIAPDGWPQRKAKILKEYQDRAERKLEPPRRPEFWTALREKLARFDPMKPVDWTQYGYKRDASGKWSMPMRQQIKYGFKEEKQD